MQKAWVIAGSIGAHETLCLLLNISCEVPVVWCLMSYGGKMVIYHVKFSKEMLIQIHTGTHIPCIFLSFFLFYTFKQHSHTFSRVNILALKKSRLKREQESEVNGVSLKKLSHCLLLRSSLEYYQPKEGEMTETRWTYVSGRGVSAAQILFNTYPLRKSILLADDSSEQQAQHACSVDNSYFLSIGGTFFFPHVCICL